MLPRMSDTATTATLLRIGVFSLLEDQRAAASAFAMLGNLATEFPWCCLRGGAPGSFDTRRHWALAGGGGGQR
jgi:hypothetical protein